MKSIILSFFLLFFSSVMLAQVGIGTTVPAGALDVTSTTDGLLIPRVALTSTSTVLPVITGTTSELVYNTTNNLITSDVSAGFYYLSTATGPWVRLGTATPVTETDPQVSSVTANRVPKWNGTTLVDGAILDTGTTVGINILTPAGALDITSTTDGLLIPRVALQGINVAAPLTTPVDSELVYNTFDNGSINPLQLAFLGRVTPGFYYWKDLPAPARWERFVTGTPAATPGWQTTGNVALAANFLGTTNAIDLVFRRNNLAAGRIAPTSTSFGAGALAAGATTNGTAFGVNALAANTAANNTAFGTNALAANNTPANNTAVGFNSLAINTANADTGDRNTAVGSGALATLNGGNNNTAVGFNALTLIPSTTRFNTAVGSNALSGINAAAAIHNVAVGYNAMTGSGTITESVAVGSGALFAARDPSTRNTALGFNAGNALTTGNDNVVIGANATVAATLNNQIAIGSGATTSTSNSIRLGNTAIATAAIQVAWSVTSDVRWKNTIKDSALGLHFLQTLRPVSYIRNNDTAKKTEYGFIAQELEIALTNAGDPNNGIISKDDNGMYGVRYNDFLPITIKAVQEQQEQIEELKKANAALQNINAAILKRLEALENK
jgi:hypothetical protein